MKIAIEARALSAGGGGVKTYARNLIENLLELEDNNSYTLITDQSGAGWRHRQTDRLDERLVPLRHKLLLPLWLQHQVPAVLKNINPDVVHFIKADVPRRKMVPTVVTIFDTIPLLFPEGQSSVRRWYWPRALKRATALSEGIITISRASKRDIVNYYNVDPRKITVTPLAVDTGHFRPGPYSSRTEQPYILFVGTLEPRKNVPLLVRAFARAASRIPHQLIIAGRPDADYENIRREITAQGAGERVELKQFVSYNDLPGLYAGADLFVWPSIYEGWGFPPQEAMACGTPVLVSDGGALPEVVGPAGEIVKFTTRDLRARAHDGAFEQQLARQMPAILASEDKRERMIQTGLKQVRKFSWKKVAQTTTQVYRQVLEQTA